MALTREEMVAAQQAAAEKVNAFVKKIQGEASVAGLTVEQFRLAMQQASSAIGSQLVSPPTS
jgi:hypothetical protein